MISCTGLAPWEFGLPFPGSRISTCLLPPCHPGCFLPTGTAPQQDPVFLKRESCRARTHVQACLSRGRAYLVHISLLAAQCCRWSVRTDRVRKSSRPGQGAQAVWARVPRRPDDHLGCAEVFDGGSAVWSPKTYARQTIYKFPAGSFLLAARIYNSAGYSVSSLSSLEVRAIRSP